MSSTTLLRFSSQPLALWYTPNQPGWMLRQRATTIPSYQGRYVCSELNIDDPSYKDERITLDKLWTCFSNITSVKTMIDICKIQFLGKIVRDHVSSPPRQLLISYVSNKRRVGRPQKCSREAMFDSLKRVLWRARDPSWSNGCIISLVFRCVRRDILEEPPGSSSWSKETCTWEAQPKCELQQ